MHRTTRIKITELNPHLICVLCGGYYIDAATIIECLHSFCRTCITRYLDTSKYCPICDVMVHKTKPLQNVKSDKTLQDLVYKLVPGLYKNEMKRRREFYASQPDTDQYSGGPSEDRGNEDQDRLIYTYDEKISVSLELYSECMADEPADPYTNQDSSPGKLKRRDVRYLLCPAAFTVGNLKKFVRMKFDLPLQYMIDVFHSEEPLDDMFTLMDIAYIYTWRRISPLRLIYTIYEVPTTKRKRAEEEMCSEKHARLDDSTDAKSEKEQQFKVCNQEVNMDSTSSVAVSKTIDVETNVVNQKKDVNTVPEEKSDTVNGKGDNSCSVSGIVNDKQLSGTQSETDKTLGYDLPVKSQSCDEQEKSSEQNSVTVSNEKVLCGLNLKSNGVSSGGESNLVKSNGINHSVCNDSIYDFDDSRDSSPDPRFSIENGFRSFSNKTVLNIPKGHLAGSRVHQNQFEGQVISNKVKFDKKLHKRKPEKDSPKSVKRVYNSSKVKSKDSPPKKLNLLTGKAFNESLPTKKISSAKLKSKELHLNSVLESLSRAKIKDSPPSKDLYDSTGKVKSSKFNGIYTPHVLNGHLN